VLAVLCPHGKVNTGAVLMKVRAAAWTPPFKARAVVLDACGPTARHWVEEPQCACDDSWAAVACTREIAIPRAVKPKLIVCQSECAYLHLSAGHNRLLCPFYPIPEIHAKSRSAGYALSDEILGYYGLLWATWYV
jgi:hypothetical protein